ncbi:MAG: 8-hydroxy-5-deazaflavin:NADPH oxidoreductase [Frankiaceae bacterium]|jgi:predicted dinucleotide-binding enzyme|nr:8-hydroxy-5-deazaflavin:NADPH oxidoreductase [Frankiaceae bacterium]
MRIAVLGTGPVGHAIASRLVEVGHDVWMGSRDAAGEKVVAWAAGHGERAHAATFAGAAAAAELLVNATGGAVSLDVLASIDEADLTGKVLLDVSNPLDFSQGFPPGLSPAVTDSAAEQLQRAHPALRVVKSLNTMNCDVMVDPTLVRGPHTVFVAGDDDDAKAAVTDLLSSFGWPRPDILDLGGLSTSRGLEAYVLFWINVRMALGTNVFNIAVVH